MPSYDIRFKKLTNKFKNLKEKKFLVSELDLEYDFWKAREERCGNEKEKEGITKKITKVLTFKNDYKRSSDY